MGGRYGKDMSNRGSGLNPSEIRFAVTVVPQLNGTWVQPRWNINFRFILLGRRGKNFTPVPSSGATGQAG